MPVFGDIVIFALRSLCFLSAAVPFAVIALLVRRYDRDAARGWVLLGLGVAAALWMIVEVYGCRPGTYGTPMPPRQF